MATDFLSTIKTVAPTYQDPDFLNNVQAVNPPRTKANDFIDILRDIRGNAADLILAAEDPNCIYGELVIKYTDFISKYNAVGVALNTVAAIEAEVLAVAAIEAEILSLYADKVTLDALYADRAGLSAIYANLPEILLADDSAATAVTEAGIATDRALEAASSASEAEDIFTKAYTDGVPTDTLLYSALHHAAKSASSAAAANADAVQVAADLVATNQDTIDSAASALAALNSETAAAGSETTAQAVLVSMQTLFDNFDDRYLGTKAVDPTLDNDGFPLSIGALYYNSVALEVRFWDGAVWESPEASTATSANAAALSAAAALLSEQNAAASETQTGLDKIATNADVVVTNADVVITNADVLATNADLVATNQDTIDTAADRAQTGLDAIATAADAVATAADVVTVAGIYDSFDDRYLGSKAIAPTLDNDGLALLDGALYWDSVLTSLRVYDGAVWSDATTLTESSTSTLVNKTLVDTSNDISANTVHYAIKANGAINQGDVLVAVDTLGDGTIIVTVQSNLSQPSIGLAAASYINNENGVALLFGAFKNYDSTGLSIGDVLYPDGTGGLTNIPTIAPTSYSQPCAFVAEINGVNAQLLLNFHSAHESANLVSYDNTGTSLVSNNLQEAVTELAPFAIHDSLLIYYGFPIAFNGAWDTAVVIEAISKYDTWVVGASYENPLHEEYASTQTIIAGVRANGVKVYGYVATNSAITIGTITTAITNWDTLNVDGIFLDEFGFDYGNTRTRQIDIVNLVTAAGLPYIGNAWVWAEVLCDTAAQLPWAVDDWRYIQFVAGNPTDLALPRTVNDGYLFENYGVSNTGSDSMWDLHDRVKECLDFNDIATTAMELHGLAVVGESVAGTPDMTLYTEFADYDALNRYIMASSYVHNLTSIGIGGFSFGSAGDIVPFEMFSLPADAEAPTAISWDFTGGVFGSYYGKYLVEVTTIGVAYSHSVTSTEGETLVNESIQHITGLQAYTDKLDGIEPLATADQTKADIDALLIDAATLDGLDSASYFSRTGETLGDNDDYNDLRKTGVYLGSLSAVNPNQPDSSTRQVIFVNSPLYPTTTNYITQTVFTNTGKQYTRYMSGDNIWTAWATVWSSTNDGTGSGLDADTLDTLDSTSFVRTDGTVTQLMDTNLRVGVTAAVGLEGGEISFQRAPSGTNTGNPFLDVYNNDFRMVTSPGGVTKVLTLPAETGTVLHSNSVVDADTLGNIPSTGFIQGKTYSVPDTAAGTDLDVVLIDTVAGSQYSSAAFTISLVSRYAALNIEVLANCNGATIAWNTPEVRVTGKMHVNAFIWARITTADRFQVGFRSINYDGGTIYKLLAEDVTAATNTSNSVLVNAGAVTAVSLNNADTLDTLDSTQFLRSDANDTYTGLLSLANTSQIKYSNNPAQANSTLNSGCGLFGGNGDLATSTTANVKIGSWYGIGFSPTISGQVVPQGENAVWIDTRNGTLGARGTITAPTFAGALTGTASNANLLDNINSTGFARLGTTTPTSNYLYTTRSSASSAMYVRQGSTGNIAQFFTNATAGATSGTGVTIANNGQIQSTTPNGTAPLTVASTTKVTNLNADLLDDRNLDINATANSVVSRDGNGYIYGNAFNSALGDTVTTPSHVMIETGSDGWMRPQTVATFRTNVITPHYVQNIGDTMTGKLLVDLDAGLTPDYSTGHLELRNANAGDVSMGFHRSGATACQLRHEGNGLILSGTTPTVAADFYAYGNITAYSDRRLKDNIEVIPNALDKIIQLSGYTFTRTNAEEGDEDVRHTGVIAQEILEVLPEAVSTDKDGMHAVSYGNMAGLFIEAIKEQQDIIAKLTARIEALEAK